MTARGPFPADDERIPLAAALRWQQRACSDLGSTLSADLVGSVAHAVETRAPTGRAIADAAVTAGLSGADGLVRYGDLLGLRLLAVAHAAVLSRTAPALAVHYPTVGGTAPPTGPSGAAARIAARTAFADALLADPGRLVGTLGRVPQTNEVGRAPLLRHALARACAGGPPVRLREIGASAGLNLRADVLPGEPAWERPRATLPVVLDRAGCDVAPLDPLTDEGRLALSSYVWAEDVERFARLGAALRVAAAVPAPVVRADAASYVESLSLEPGTALVVWHSAMWVYLDADQRRRVLTAVAALGAAAGAGSPVWHLSWEWRPAATDAGDWFALVARGWPGPHVEGLPEVAPGAPLLLATGSSHGSLVTPVHPAVAVRPDPLVR